MALVRWPLEQELRDVLAAEGRPRLLLIEAWPAPVVVDSMEDWIKVPADPFEMSARIDNPVLRQDDYTPAG